MKKLIILALVILLSLSTFAKDNYLVKTKITLVGAGIGMFATGFILHQREMNSSHKFEGPGIGVSPNQFLQGVGLSMVGIGIVIRF